MAEAPLALTGYEHYYGMMADGIRMRALRDAIFQVVKEGDVVADLGAGLGVLGLWAAQAGASRVYAIEKTESLDLAQQVARINGLEDRMVFLRDLSTDVELPERVDVLVSETLGSFAIDENTLPYILDARSRFLKPGGRLLPLRLELFAAPVEAQAAWDRIDIWNHVEGLDYSPAFDVFAGKMLVETLSPAELMAPAVQVADIDLQTWQKCDLQARVMMRMQRQGTVHGVAGWFCAHLTEDITIHTAPEQPETHWKQAFFPFRQPIQVIEGDLLEWSLHVEGGNSADGTRLSYTYRCTQLANEPGKPPASPSTGRNDPCPCGSGKKYKHCCST